MRPTEAIRVAIIWAIYLPIVGITYLVVWIDRHWPIKLPFPRNVVDLSVKNEWCIAALKESGAIPKEANITKYNVNPLDQSLIFRSNAGVLDIEYKCNVDAQHTRFFVKFAPNVGSVWNRAIFNLQQNHTKEIDFNLCFTKSETGIPAPRVYVAKMSLLTGNFCLITEFMNNSVELKDSIHQNIPEQYINQAVEGMAILHSTFWKSSHQSLNKIHRIDRSTVLLFESMMLRSWSSNARKILNISWNYANIPQTVIHGDARIGNMMFSNNKPLSRFVFFDWQAVRQGIGVYDLAYFLVLSLSAGERKQAESSALHYYHHALLKNGITQYSFEQLQKDYNHCCLCVLVLLSLPFLSGEASAEQEGARIFAWGMGIWRDRLVSKMESFDYQWMKQHYQMEEAEAKSAIAEMINTINRRLEKIEHTGSA